MNLRQTIIRTAVLVVVLVGLGLYFYLYEQKGGKKREEAQEEAKKIFQLDKDKVVELRLARPEEEAVVCAKKEDKWVIEEPVNADADQDAVNRVVSELVDAKRTRTVEEEPDDLALYGLDKPSFTLAAVVQEKEEPARLLFGEQNPAKTAFYAKTETEKPVFLVQSYVKRSLDKKLYDLRNKKVADFKKDEVEALKLERGELKIEVEKQDDGTWRMTSPLDTRGDKSEIDKIMDKMNSARVEEFINDDPQDLAQYGLDSPEIKLTMLIGEDRASKTLLIGRKNEDKKGYYGKRAEQKTVFLLKEDFVDAVPEEADTLRDHNLLTVDTGDVHKMEYVTEEQTFVLAKNEEGDWEIKEPIQEKGDNLKTNDLITDLKNIKVKEFFDEEKEEFGLAKPDIAVTLWKKDVEKPIKVAIAAKDEEKEVVYARNMDGIAVAIDEAAVDKVRKTLFDFRNKLLVSFDKEDVRKMTVRYGEDELVVAQRDEKWRAEKPERFKIGRESDVDSLVWALNYLKMEEIVEEQKPGDLAEFGLDKPRAEFSVELNEDKSVGPFLIGKSKDGNVYVVTAEKPGLYLVKDSLLDDLKRELGDILDKELPDPEDLLKPKEEPEQETETSEPAASG